MARRSRKRRSARPLPGDPTDPQGLAAWTLRYLEALEVRHRSPATIRTKRGDLGSFLAWCQDRGLRRPQNVTRPILQRYQRHLFHYRKKSGKPLAVTTQHRHLIALRGFFKWLTREGVILSNPASELDLPRLPKRLPRDVLTVEEVEAVLALPDVEGPFGVRDRALLELLYSTGIRRMEVVALGVFDLEPGRGTLRVYEGKGRRDRVVPVGERALAWCQRYLDEVRPQLVHEPDPGAYFLTKDGDPFTPNRLSQLVRDYIVRADLGKEGACHLFRHSAATVMLENGADIRFIQEMLGHASLATTQVYTRVSIRKLQEIHAATHPGARLRPRLLEEDLEETEEPEGAV